MMLAGDRATMRRFANDKRGNRMKSMWKETLLAAGLIVTGAAAAADAAADANMELAQKTGCLACHAVDKKLVGPSYKDIAAKYKGEKGAEAHLVQKVLKGGGGVWGQIPMPPNNVSDAQAQQLVKWILSF
jgi:cytochrome c